MPTAIKSTCHQILPEDGDMRIEAIQAAATMELTGIPKEAFTSCFQDLQKHWQQCTDCGGNYFEGDRKH
jgi:hypothetical protein